MDTNQPFIVAIDDSPTICRIIEVILAREGYRVQTFLDPTVALRQIFVTGATTMPNVLFVDLVFPAREMDGFEIITRIRNHPLGKTIPIIVMSRRKSLLDRIKLRLLGVDTYLVKPFQTQAIINLVKYYTTVKPDQ